MPRKPVLLAVLAWAASAGAGAGDDAEASAAHMYDRAVELCGAGSLDALNECQALLGQSVALAPDQALAHLTLGHTHRTLRSWEAAVRSFGQVGGCTRARAGAPDGAPPWALEDAGMHLGRSLIELDRWDDAIHAFEATFTSFPGASEALYRHLYLQHFACNLTRRAELLQTVRERVAFEVHMRGGSQMTPSQALMMLDGEELLLVSQAYAAGHMAVRCRHSPRPERSNNSDCACSNLAGRHECCKTAGAVGMVAQSCFARRTTPPGGVSQGVFCVHPSTPARHRRAVAYRVHIKGFRVFVCGAANSAAAHCT